MEMVEVMCPRSIDLTSIDAINNKLKDNAKFLLETIDIYDSVVIKEEVRKRIGLVIISNENLNKSFQETIKRVINIFFQYTNLKIRDIYININLNSLKYLRSEENVLSGLLIGLNLYFKTNLTMHELIFLANKVNRLISYYLVGGYKKIDVDGKISNIGENLYSKYYLLEPKIEMTSEEKEKIKNFLNQYPNIEYGFQDIYFIAIKSNISSMIPISLKKEFNNIGIYTINNVKNHKVLAKYLK